MYRGRDKFNSNNGKGISITLIRSQGRIPLRIRYQSNGLFPSFKRIKSFTNKMAINKTLLGFNTAKAIGKFFFHFTLYRRNSLSITDNLQIIHDYVKGHRDFILFLLVKLYFFLKIKPENSHQEAALS